MVIVKDAQGAVPDHQGGNNMTHYAYGFFGIHGEFNEFGGSADFDECLRLAHQDFGEDFADLVIIKVEYVDGCRVETWVV